MGKKISFISYLLFRFAIFIMAIAIAYICFWGSGTLKIIKFPLVGGEIQFDKEEKLPEGTVKIALNQAKYIFDDNFILRVRPNGYDLQTDNSFAVSFYRITGTEANKTLELYKSIPNMIPGNILSINYSDHWYHARMLQIKRDGEDTYCYFDVYTSKENVLR